MTTKSEIHPEFESLVQRIIETVEKDRLEALRKDFHTRLRITLTHPDSSELVEDLWDFFYDWCVFEQKLPEVVPSLNSAEQDTWSKVKEVSERGLYSVAKLSEDSMKLKDLYTGKTITVSRRDASDFVGIDKGDLLEGRILKEEDTSYFVRRPSYHPAPVHNYIKAKVKQFRKSQDFATYQSWLWLLVGMYLKHRIYSHMPIDKIYDDNSRI